MNRPILEITSEERFFDTCVSSAGDRAACEVIPMDNPIWIEMVVGRHRPAEGSYTTDTKRICGCAALTGCGR